MTAQLTLFTRNKSYQELQEILEPLQKKILDFIIANPGCSDRDIADGLHLEIGTVCGRRNKLSSPPPVFLDRPVIEEAGTKKSSTGKTVTTWRITQSEKIGLDKYPLL